MNRLCKIFFVFFTAFFVSAIPPVYADTDKIAEEQVLMQENFRKMIPLSIQERAIKKLKENHFPVENLKNMTQPQGWFINSVGMPHDLKMTSENGGWRIATSQKTEVVSPSIKEMFSDFTVDVTLCVEDAPATVILSVLQYRFFNNAEVLKSQKETLRAGETKTIHLPIHFDLLNPGFRILFKISGDVTLKDFSVRGTPVDFTERGYTCVEGTIEACSAIPDPKKSDYPDCRFTCRFKGENICYGKQCPLEIQLILDGFQNYRLLASSALKEGDMLRCILYPFEKLPDSMKSIQQADDLDLFQLDNYYVVNFEKITMFKKKNSVPFDNALTAHEHISVFERQINPPLTEDVIKKQKNAIADDLATINTTLDKWSKKQITETNEAFFKAWNEEKAKDSPGYNRVTIKGKKYVWRHISGSFWSLPEIGRDQLIRKYTPIAPENMEALVAFRDFLQANGCQFILCLVPDAYDISARVILPEFRDVPDFSMIWTVRELLQNGIEAVYASDEIIKNFNRYPWAFFYPADPHPSDTCQDILSDIVAQKLERFGFSSNMNPKLFTVVPRPHAHDGWYRNHDYAFPADCDIGSNRAGESYLCRCVMYDKKTVRSNPTSSILVFGNSYMQMPMNNPESFPTLLSLKMHMSISFYRVNAYGPMTSIMRDFFNTPETFLRGKKVVIMCVGVQHLHAPIKFNNLKTMDQTALLMSEKKAIATVAMQGNTKKEPDFAKNLSFAKFFEIPQKGVCTVLDFAIPDVDKKKECVVLIPTCANAPFPVKLIVNGETIDVELCSSQYYWNKAIVRLPAGTSHIKIELKGKPGNVVAISDIQIYQ
ncbi:MAG: hypothetical protein MJ033_06050 [Victivallaceae bacterium]|nr:hypothetical protein [Victivallaceae bacterium]